MDLISRTATKKISVLVAKRPANNLVATSRESALIWHSGTCVDCTTRVTRVEAA